MVAPSARAIDEIRAARNSLPTKYRGAEWHRSSMTHTTEIGSETTNFLYDHDNVVADLQDGNIVKFYVTPFLDQNLSMTDSSGTYYYSHDGLGSVRLLTDSSGVVKNVYDTDAFGVPYAPGTSVEVEQRYTYTAREKNPVSTLMYYRWRKYEAGVGRFLGRDPIYYDGSPDGNLYGYAANRPLIILDRFGLCYKDGREENEFSTSYEYIPPQVREAMRKYRKQYGRRAQFAGFQWQQITPALVDAAAREAQLDALEWLRTWYVDHCLSKDYLSNLEYDMKIDIEWIGGIGTHRYPKGQGFPQYPNIPPTSIGGLWVQQETKMECFNCDPQDTPPPLGGPWACLVNDVGECEWQCCEEGDDAWARFQYGVITLIRPPKAAPPGQAIVQKSDYFYARLCNGVLRTESGQGFRVPASE